MFAKAKKLSFGVSTAILNQFVEIAELVCHVNASLGLSASPILRHANRIRIIYFSLSNEQNTLSLEQVTAILSGKRIIAPPKDIAEAKNAYEIYEMMDSLNPYSVDHLLSAHDVMIRGLVEEFGCFRSRPVGVVDEQGNVLHFGTLPDYVPVLVEELLGWVRDSDFHTLIKSCVFHYELELIHLFADGNGRIGCLWHTQLLTQWNPTFAWFPVESIIHDRKDEYYQAINCSDMEVESTVFIEFMLSAIKETLIESVQPGNIENMTTDEQRWYQTDHF